MHQTAVRFAALCCAVAAVALIIEFTGGLPSQLAHLYYVPVVAAALLLPWRYSIAVAVLAGVAVSPFPDVIHRPLGLHVYYADASPWRFGGDGWIVRPLAFLAIGVLGSRLVETRLARQRAETTSAARGSELGILSEIDRLILSGTSEERVLGEIARMAAGFAGASHAGVVLPNEDGKTQTYYGRLAEGDEEIVEDDLPLGEGVSGWAIQHRKVAVSENVFTDPRYDRMRALAQRLGFVSAAAAPIVLDGETLGSLALGYREERRISDEEIGTLTRLANQAAVAVANARQRESLRRLSYETALGLAEAIESRDPYTGDHCTRLAGYAAITAKLLGMTSAEVEVIRLGAALHDVGKIVVPDDILKKADKLTPPEYNVIKQHCYVGGQLCKRISALQDAYPIVYHHHERWDGQGYPDRISGEQIPIGARIVAIADAFDAMTHDRPYRPGMSHEEARDLLAQGGGSQWDPEILAKFLTLRWERGDDGSLRAAA